MIPPGIHYGLKNRHGLEDKAREFQHLTRQAVLAIMAKETGRCPTCRPRNGT